MRILIFVATLFVACGCGIFSSPFVNAVQDLVNEGLTSLVCDPSKILAPSAADCDPQDQVAIECIARTKTGNVIGITVCAEVKVDR